MEKAWNEYKEAIGLKDKDPLEQLLFDTFEYGWHSASNVAVGYLFLTGNSGLASLLSDQLNEEEDFEEEGEDE